MPIKKIGSNESVFPAFQHMKLKYKDIFDLKEFYDALHEYLLENNWSGDEINDKSSQNEYWETYYYERETAGGSKEHWIRWRLQKPAPETEFLTLYLDIDWHTLAIMPAEVIKEGQKIKVNKGEVELHIKGYIEKKYEKEFEKSSILKVFTKLWNQRIYSGILGDRKKEFYQEIYALNNFIKQWFKLKRYLPYEESKGFFSSYAWPSHQKEE